MDFEIGYTSREVTPWGGMVFLRKMLGNLDFAGAVEGQPDLPRPGSNAGYDPRTILEGFITSIWCGASRFLHTEVTRHDAAIARIFGWKRTPGQDTYKRFFARFTDASLHRTADHFYRWIFSKQRFDNYTLDCDSTVITRYGCGSHQQGARKGYNPKKPGRLSHHPLIAFVSDVNMVANMWLRSGDTASSNNFLSFLEDTLSKLEGKRIGLLRLDSGFCCDEVLSYVENKGIDYITAARFHEPVQRLLAGPAFGQGQWLPLAEGIEIREGSYQAAGWKSARRLVMVRQRVAERPAAPGKTLRLFEDDEVIAGYRYSAWFTSLKLPPPEVWRLYRGRAGAENRIKELKTDFGFDAFNMRSFTATAAALTVAMLAYNLMSMFRQFLMQSSVQHTLSTLRYKTFAIGAYFERLKDKVVLRLSLNLKRRKWFEGLWMQTANNSPPFALSTA